MRYTFGSISVDTGARTISNATGDVHLTRKAFDLLLLLLESRPNAVTKDQIYARLWPHTFVSEASLQTLIHEIRLAIDDSGAPSSWIRTVHGIGYAFTEDVVVVDASSLEAPVRPAAWLAGESTRIALHSGEQIIGRDMEGVVEIDAPTVSRRHARITVGQESTIEDLGSKNGTWVNDLRVTGPHVLTDRDLVSFGSLRFIFQLVRRPISTESAELPPQV